VELRAGRDKGDAVRSILDGHITLSRQLGSAGHFPAIQVLDSVSRLESRLADAKQAESARRIRQALAIYRQSEDLINLGAYVSGSNPKLDSAIRSRTDLMQFLRQKNDEVSSMEETMQRMDALAAAVQG